MTWLPPGHDAPAGWRWPMQTATSALFGRCAQFSRLCANVGRSLRCAWRIHHTARRTTSCKWCARPLRFVRNPRFPDETAVVQFNQIHNHAGSNGPGHRFDAPMVEAVSRPIQLLGSGGTAPAVVHALVSPAKAKTSGAMHEVLFPTTGECEAAAAARRHRCRSLNPF